MLCAEVAEPSLGARIDPSCHCDHTTYVMGALQCPEWNIRFDCAPRRMAAFAQCITQKRKEPSVSPAQPLIHKDLNCEVASSRHVPTANVLSHQQHDLFSPAPFGVCAPVHVHVYVYVCVSVCVQP